MDRLEELTLACDPFGLRLFKRPFVPPMTTPKLRLHEDTEITIPCAPKKPKSPSKSKHDARIADFQIEEEATRERERERAERGHKAKKRKLLEATAPDHCATRGPWGLAGPLAGI